MEYNSSPNAKKKKNDNEQTITTCVKVLGHLHTLPVEAAAV